MENLEQLAQQLLRHRVHEEEGGDQRHAELMDNYLALCKELGVEPDPKVMSAYSEFLDVYTGHVADPAAHHVEA